MMRVLCSAISTLGLMALSFSAISAEEGSVPYPQGASLFQKNCVVCHGATGGGIPSLAPPLTTNPAQYARSREGRRQLAMTLLYGLFGDVVVEQKHYNFKMPEFVNLDDESIADMLNYVVFGLGRAPDSVVPLEPGEIAQERAHPVDAEAVRRHRSSLVNDSEPSK